MKRARPNEYPGEPRFGTLRTSRGCTLGAMRFTSIVITVAVVTSLLACSSESDVGEACERPGGSRDVCEQGTVCGKPSDKSSALVCIPTCANDDQCPKDYGCKGVEGTSIKGCRFKD